MCGGLQFGVEDRATGRAMACLAPSIPGRDTDLRPLNGVLRIGRTGCRDHNLRNGNRGHESGRHQNGANATFESQGLFRSGVFSPLAL